MKTFLKHIWSRLRRSFWFIPGIIVSLAALIASGSLAFDRYFESQLLETFSIFENVSPSGVRSLLSTSATAVLTLAGITFSSTLVALTLASSQFGGRLLRNFIRSLPNQVSLGVLLGSFVFCLIVLRSVRGAEDGQFVPHIATLLAFLSTIGSLMTFIYFIHHIATSLQADQIVSDVYEELDQALEHHFPDRAPDDGDEREADGDHPTWEETEDEVELSAQKSGCIQAVAIETLVELASNLDLRCRILQRPGHFVNEGTGLLAIAGAGATGLKQPQREALTGAVIIGRMRTAEQDFEYCLRQLVEISLRALSPGINDPFTAMNCIDFLGAALAKVTQRRLPERHFSDADGKLRVISPPTTFSDLLGAAFNQIRQAADGRTDISLRLLGALAGIGAKVRLAIHAESVVGHAEMIAAAGRRAAQAEIDANAIDAALDCVYERLNVSPK